MRKSTLLSLFLLSLFYFITTPIAGQYVSFGYDASGNQISKRIYLANGNPKFGAAEKDNKSAEPLSERLNDRDITIYPNPTKGIIAVEITDLDPDVMNFIRVFDMQGKIILDKKASSIRTELNLTDMPAGSYLLVILLGNDKTTWNIIKE